MLFDQLRTASREVMRRARSVSIDDARLEALARELGDGAAAQDGDPARQSSGDPAARLAFVVTLDAVNFGSGWFPFMNKRPGRSGYFTIALSLEEYFAREGPPSAGRLQGLAPGDCARLFGQDLAVPEMAELMGHFSRALSDLGALLEREYDGRFEGLVTAADESAEQLVRLLAQLPAYRDVSSYEELTVPFYKRAQITAADLAEAFEGRGVGFFRDLDALTAFADNLVPHVLRCEGVLRYSPELAQRIGSERAIEAGSMEEVEIRAAAVHVVDRMAACIRSRGGNIPPRVLDNRLWNRGQQPSFKARPRHRTRSLYY